jgi:drug/metabolite transporter (DMT)-like permease
VFVRFLLLSALSLVVLFVRGRRGGKAWRISRADVPLLIVSGLSGYGFYQLFYMIGLAHTTVFASALFISTVPVWSLIILAVLKIERVHPIQWAGIALSLVGLVGFLLAATGRSAEVPHTQHLTPSDPLLGNLLSLAAGALFALYGVTNKRLTMRYSPPELMCYTLLIGTLALAPFGVPALLSQLWQHVTWRTLLIVPYSVLFPIYLTN